MKSKPDRAQPARVRFRLQFPPGLIRPLAERFSFESPEGKEEERLLLESVGPAIRQARSMNKAQLLRLARWKSPRVVPRVMENSAYLVEEATTLAFHARDEALRIGILTTLNGVGWPVASVLLHFGHPDPYPILDFRALESLGVKQPSSYSFDFWWGYVLTCRKLATRHGVDMRTLDRALWQHSAEHAPRSRR